jgi:hypothetical protein
VHCWGVWLTGAWADAIDKYWNRRGDEGELLWFVKQLWPPGSGMGDSDSEGGEALRCSKSSRASLIMAS